MSLNWCRGCLGILGIIAFATGCSGDKSSPSAPEPVNAKIPSIVTLNTPDKALLLCGSQYPLAAREYTSMAKRFDSLFRHVPPAGSTVDSFLGGYWEYYAWTDEQLQITLFCYDTLPAYDWRIIFGGNKGGIDYFDWTYLQAEETDDKSLGWMRKTEKDPSQLDYRWDWTTLHGQVDATISWVSGADQLEFHILQNANLSGFGEYRQNGVIAWKVDWGTSRPSCSGMWYFYTGGVMTASGSWGYSEG